MKIIKCPSCQSEIAIDKTTIYPIDCDCGEQIKEAACDFKQCTNSAEFETKVGSLPAHYCEEHLLLYIRDGGQEEYTVKLIGA